MPAKAIPEMTRRNVSGGTLNSTHSLWFPDTISMLSLLLSEINDITCAVKNIYWAFIQQKHHTTPLTIMSSVAQVLTIVQWSHVCGCTQRCRRWKK